MTATRHGPLSLAGPGALLLCAAPSLAPGARPAPPATVAAALVAVLAPELAGTWLVVRNGTAIRHCATTA
ncbi:hypothetical protein [Streptomyces sp. AC555_RSS877]|uniref:hypothetical protein n=1 Tax=Streptomyces sp. AC555_RSS877 TaxID=2823688 RepID=UPI001C25DD6C|nr:hypothetical protein [Streptomyces sp. AC555_RSS877]